MDYPQGERAITHHVQCGLVGANDSKVVNNEAKTNGLTCLPKYGGKNIKEMNYINCILHDTATLFSAVDIKVIFHYNGL
jgi:hypothetical protein